MIKTIITVNSVINKRQSLQKTPLLTKDKNW